MKDDSNKGSNCMPHCSVTTITRQALEVNTVKTHRELRNISCLIFQLISDYSTHFGFTRNYSCNLFVTDGKFEMLADETVDETTHTSSNTLTQSYTVGDAVDIAAQRSHTERQSPKSTSKDTRSTKETDDEREQKNTVRQVTVTPVFVLFSELLGDYTYTANALTQFTCVISYTGSDLK